MLLPILYNLMPTGSIGDTTAGTLIFFLLTLYTLHYRKHRHSALDLRSSSTAADDVLDRKTHPADPTEPLPPAMPEAPVRAALRHSIALPQSCRPARTQARLLLLSPLMSLTAFLVCCFSEPGAIPGKQTLAAPRVAAAGGMLHPPVPVPGDWATSGCPLVAPAPRGSAGEIPRDPVSPFRQVAASLVSTINPAGEKRKAKGRQ